MERMGWSYWGNMVMTFEELKIRIEGQDSVLLKCSPKFVVKQMNLFNGLEGTHDIILIAKLFYNDNYSDNNKPVQGDIIGGSIIFHPKLNPLVPSTDSNYICSERGDGEIGRMSMMILNDEDCADIEVLNVCVMDDCGL